MNSTSPPDYSKAKCIGAPTKLMFPERGEDQTEGKKICSDCPIKAECLEDNINESVGIFGGTSGKERTRIRKARRNGSG